VRGAKEANETLEETGGPRDHVRAFAGRGLGVVK
jgi:hypothetical protein